MILALQIHCTLTPSFDCKKLVMVLPLNISFGKKNQCSKLAALEGFPVM